MLHLLVIVALLGLPIVPVFAADATPTLDPHINQIVHTLQGQVGQQQLGMLTASASFACESIAGVGTSMPVWSRTCWPVACGEQAIGAAAQVDCRMAGGLGQVRIGYYGDGLVITVQIPVN